MSWTARPSLRIVVGPNSASSIGASAIFAATAEPGPASDALGGAHIGELAGIDAGWFMRPPARSAEALDQARVGVVQVRIERLGQDGPGPESHGVDVRQEHQEPSGLCCHPVDAELGRLLIEVLGIRQGNHFAPELYTGGNADEISACRAAGAQFQRPCRRLFDDAKGP